MIDQIRYYIYILTNKIKDNQKNLQRLINEKINTEKNKKSDKHKWNALNISQLIEESNTYYQHSGLKILQKMTKTILEFLLKSTQNHPLHRHSEMSKQI